MSRVWLVLTAVCAAAVAALCTVCFTLIDDVVTPLYFRYSASSWAAYFVASLPVMATQTVCAAVTVALLTFPLVKIYSCVKL